MDIGNTTNDSMTQRTNQAKSVATSRLKGKEITKPDATRKGAPKASERDSKRAAAEQGEQTKAEVPPPAQSGGAGEEAVVWQRLVAEAAYFRAERRGFIGGSPEQDWYEAEDELRRHRKQTRV